MTTNLHGVSESAIAKRLHTSQGCVSRAARHLKSPGYDDASLKFITTFIKHHNIDTRLTPKNKLFCKYYVECLNATKAYMLAYHASYKTGGTRSSKLLKKKPIQHLIHKINKNSPHSQLNHDIKHVTHVVYKPKKLTRWQHLMAALTGSDK